MLAMGMAGALPVLAQEAPDASLRDTLKQLERTKEQAEALEEKLKEAQSELSDVQAESVKLGQGLQHTERKIADKSKSLAILEKELTTKQQSQEARKADVARLVHGMIRMQRMPRQFVIAQPGNADGLLRTASALDITYRSVAEEMASLSVQMEEIEALKDKVTDARDKLQEQQVEQQSEQDELQAMVKERQQQFRALNQNHQQVKDKVSALSQESTSLQDLIGRLKKEEAIFSQMAMPQPKPRAPTRPVEQRLASLPEPMPPARAPTESAASAPVMGKIIHRYGERSVSGDKRSGHVIQTAPAALVTAPKGGRVVYSGTFMEYGNMIIIQHDGGMHTVLAGLNDVKVEPGQPLRAGEPVGVMGNTLPDRELYLELRKDSKPIDPTAWMGNLTRGVARNDR